MRVHFVCGAKADGRRKIRLVAGGHMLDPPKAVTHSGVTTLRSIRLFTFLSELNNLKLIGIDVGNACLTAKCHEKCHCVAPEFFEHAADGEAMVGCCLEVIQALYGLRSSGAAFHNSFADALRDLDFTPSKADLDV